MRRARGLQDSSELSPRAKARVPKEWFFLPLLLTLAAGPLLGQTAPPAPPPAPTQSDAKASEPKSFQAKVQDLAHGMTREPRLKRLPESTRKSLVEFIVGNMLFAVAHEMGHAVVGELELPVLGREEDAADSFATVASIKMMTDFSNRVLMEAARGWFLNARRDKKEGAMALYYDEHGMNEQRAYQIVCFMVGSNPVMFQDLAKMNKLPATRVKSCREDYAIAAWAWETVLKPHLRAPDQPKAKIDVSYGEGKGKLDIYERVFRELGFLEKIAEMAADKFVWPGGPFQMEMLTCGSANASWNVKQRKVKVCYELAAEFAETYREFANDQKPAKSKQGSASARR